MSNMRGRDHGPSDATLKAKVFAVHSVRIVPEPALHRVLIIQMPTGGCPITSQQCTMVMQIEVDGFWACRLWRLTLLKSMAFKLR